MAVVKAICISEKKGTPKMLVDECEFIENFGLAGDAHAGNWHRQVSLLAYETIRDFNHKGADVVDGSFGENLIIEGIDLVNLPVGTRLKFDVVELEITQIGKECHVRCGIYYRMGNCIMPTNGVFAKVVTGGKIRIDEVVKYED